VGLKSVTGLRLRLLGAPGAGLAGRRPGATRARWR